MLTLVKPDYFLKAFVDIMFNIVTYANIKIGKKFKFLMRYGCMTSPERNFKHS